MPYVCRKLGKMSQNLPSAAVVIGPLRVKAINLNVGEFFIFLKKTCKKSLKTYKFTNFLPQYNFPLNPHQALSTNEKANKRRS